MKKGTPTWVCTIAQFIIKFWTYPRIVSNLKRIFLPITAWQDKEVLQFFQVSTDISTVLIMDIDAKIPWFLEIFHENVVFMKINQN